MHVRYREHSGAVASGAAWTTGEMRAAHAHRVRVRAEIESSTRCDGIDGMATFAPTDVEEWAEKGVEERPHALPGAALLRLRTLDVAERPLQ